MMVWLIVRLGLKILAAPAAWWLNDQGFLSGVGYAGGVFGISAAVTAFAIPILYFGSRVLAAHEQRRREVRAARPLPQPPFEIVPPEKSEEATP